MDTVDVSGSGARVVFSIHRSVAFHEGWIGLGFVECGEKIKALVSLLYNTFKTIHPFYKLLYMLNKNTFISSRWKKLSAIGMFKKVVC